MVFTVLIAGSLFAPYHTIVAAAAHRNRDAAEPPAIGLLLRFYELLAV